MKYVAMTQKIALPADTSIKADVGIGPIPAGFGIQVTLNVTIPGMERAAAEKLVETAHGVCPYSNATRGNIDVTLERALTSPASGHAPRPAGAASVRCAPAPV